MNACLMSPITVFALYFAHGMLDLSDACIHARGLLFKTVVSCPLLRVDSDHPSLGYNYDAFSNLEFRGPFVGPLRKPINILLNGLNIFLNFIYELFYIFYQAFTLKMYSLKDNRL